MAALDEGSRVAETAAGPIEFASNGEGPTLLLFHGGPGGHDQGLILEPLVAEGFHVVSPSRPGYLRTPLEVGATHAEQADAIAALLDTLEIEGAIACGYSAGGPVALQFAARHADRTRGLLLECAVSQCYRPEISPLAKALFLSDYGTYLQSRIGLRLPKLLARELIRQESSYRGKELGRLAAELVGDPAKLRVLKMLMASLTPYDLRREGLENDLVELGTIDRLPFENVTAPTLVLHGTEDADVPFADAQLAAGSIIGARLAAIDGGWHVLPLSRQSAVADKERLAFLRGLADAPMPAP